MCGILCEIYFSNTSSAKISRILDRIKNRGPDCEQSLKISLGDGICAFFCGAVLWMQGLELTKQPLENEQGVLLYNGDIFDEAWDFNVSDTQTIMEKLFNKTKKSPEDYIINQLKQLKGPFAIIYYDKIHKKMYLTRDKIGRSSLLFHKNKNSIIISNVLEREYDCVEIPATYIHIIDVNTHRIKLCPWNHELYSCEELSIEEWLNDLQKKQSLPDDKFNFNSKEEDFSEEDEVVEYIRNVGQQIKCKVTAMKKLLEHVIIRDTVLKVTELLEKSIKLRLNRQPNKCKMCLNNNTGIEETCNHCTVGVLFSGGLDCTILAFLAHKYLPKEQSIDLINVAFKKDDNGTYNVPDRLTGRKSLEELQKLCPVRKWVFREVNVPKDEIEKHQENTIGDLIYPRQTILDESLGTALWFAARGKDHSDTSTSRVLLVGSGADELFGGYVRHRNAYKRRGWQGLSKELQLDWNRISFRNLARDNRVICDHGRQPRMPYLDEDFTDYVLQLKPWLRCFPSEDLSIGIGDKLTLRLVAFHQGLIEAASLPKRALQFGSRIANKKEKGSDLSKTFFKNINISNYIIFLNDSSKYLSPNKILILVSQTTKVIYGKS